MFNSSGPSWLHFDLFEHSRRNPDDNTIHQSILLLHLQNLWHQCCFHRCTRRLWDAYSVRAYHWRETLAANCLLCHEDPCGILHSMVDAKLGTTNHKISEENKTCDAWYIKPICDWTCPDANRKSLQL